MNAIWWFNLNFFEKETRIQAYIYFKLCLPKLSYESIMINLLKKIYIWMRMFQ